MPKLKTSRGTAKRFRRTATGKITRHRANRRHLLTTKRRKRKRQLRRPAVVTGTKAKAIARLIPYG